MSKSRKMTVVQSDLPKKKSIKLSITQRLKLAPLLPVTGPYIDLLTIKKLRDTILLTSDEVSNINLTRVRLPNGDEKVIWDNSRATVKILELNQHEERILADALIESACQSVGDHRALPLDLIDIFEDMIISNETFSLEYKEKIREAKK